MGLVTAAVLAGLACPPDAQALALGRVIVHSALGDPLRAEIEIPQISAEESASLQVGLGSPEAFQSAGLDYNPALAGVQISLQRHPDGRHYLRLTSSRPMLEPFLDVVISTQWSSGRLLVRRR
ncbi:hypothetical protein [Ramlibacter sp. 2FC]|uniref:type IV pilus assembly protein FimV n=1 Tax=Ramlibacter sp. 2FC TaxID=2502188 RepID=UPI0010F8B540|nr:hypothetical protein [Ramlibacter sp. 2FC]